MFKKLKRKEQNGILKRKMKLLLKYKFGKKFVLPEKNVYNIHTHFIMTATATLTIKVRVHISFKRTQRTGAQPNLI